jgi:hypothetical protein
MQTNQERANVLIGAVFAQLLPAWPMHVHLGVRRISQIAFDSREQKDLLTALSLVQWLSDEGYIRFKSIGDAVFHQSILTEKGLRVLNSVPDGITSKESFGEQLEKAAEDMGKDVAKDSAKKVIADLVGEMIGGVIKSMSS